ncbi:hypothetical protein LWI29_037190 [Acer saccharum]|uniref:Uncharacterized protein n=1 Tax=Acer saccharum TaxID=4024 RepID=A0AA39T602_ACESA|nr:hypothetical protein LWI29_037190 [Acer saccharum]
MEEDLAQVEQEQVDHDEGINEERVEQQQQSQVRAQRFQKICSKLSNGVIKQDHESKPSETGTYERGVEIPKVTCNNENNPFDDPEKYYKHDPGKSECKHYRRL